MGRRPKPSKVNPLARAQISGRQVGEMRPGGRLAVVAISKEGKQGAVMKAYEWSHKHFPNLVDCRPIFVSRALEAAGFTIKQKSIEHMWVPVEIVLGVKPS